MPTPRGHRQPWIGLLALVAGLAIPASVRADSSVWSFAVRDLVEEAPHAHVIHLVPAPTGPDYPRSCAEFVIHARLEPGQGAPPTLRSFFDAEGYDRAIREIQAALSNGKLIRLGSLDRGFARLEDDEDCVVRSAGLAILLDEDRVPTIYSVF